MKTTIKFNNVNTLFSKSLKERINDYFKSNKIQKTGEKKVLTKAIILFFTAISFYIILVVIQPHWLIAILVCILLGINFAAIGFNVMHDAGHDTFSNSKKLNNALSYSLNLMGGNIYFWKLKHNIAHHTYTNIEGEDHDIDIKFMRVHKDQELKKHHSYQKYYFMVLYSISYLAWIFYQDYEKYFLEAMGSRKKSFDFPLREKVIFWVSKAIHISIFIVIPILTVGWLSTLVGLLISGIACGICLATVFQLAHVVTETEFVALEETTDATKMENEWMIHQLSSTANFATKNKFLTWILGGLNYQVEHHLFPKISHIHYPAINKLVRETCLEFNVKYLEYKTFNLAFKSHVNVIQSMSR